MSGEGPKFEKEVVEMDDGRYLILYEFPEQGERVAGDSPTVEVETNREERSET